ncbi:hypothetical protein Vadar_030512 [Vaccinium darrowii]|uniref:Uncharacterized protein n=1 Tax=Vaccinium darrowii TaxID=229202 RepID=A0ACB7YR89_9ERIC|nr:hypothetical protein Vadar_030512 [Vaccinium darrowii]
MAGSDSSEAPASPPRETPTINSCTKTKSKFSIRYLAADFKAKFCVSKHKPVENNRKKTHHGGALSLSYRRSRNHLLFLEPALENYTYHANVQINLAREKFKELQNLKRSGRHFDELRRAIQTAIAELKRQIPSEVNIPSTIKKDDQHGEAQPHSFEIIPDDILLMDSALKNYTDYMNVQISEAREKLKEMQNLGSSERDFDEVQKVIMKLHNPEPVKLQIREPIREPVNIISLAKIEDDLRFLDLMASKNMNESHEKINKINKVNLEVREKINQLREKFKELQTTSSSKGYPAELQKAFVLHKEIEMLRLQIAFDFTGCKRHDKPHKNPWPNVNKAKDEVRHFFYKEPEVAHAGDFDGQLKAFRDLPEHVGCCLLCFFKFPAEATIKRTTMIYLWMGQEFFIWGSAKEHKLLDPGEIFGQEIFDELIAKDFIEPVNQKYSLVPDSCRMKLSVRSSLLEEAEKRGFTSNGTLDLDLGFVRGDDLPGHSCLINVGEAIIDCRPAIFENMKHIRSLYLGRWQSSAKHHIELVDGRILHGLKMLCNLTFLSLRGISMITELPTSISELKILEILDLRACHDLEVIPDTISLLKRLEHLDMSECYFLEHMPKSLDQLPHLEVLKGFFIGDVNDNTGLCTLYDLSRDIEQFTLTKLNIYTSVKQFPREPDVSNLQRFKYLKKLTISWGVCSLQGQSNIEIQDQFQGSGTPFFLLEKLDLRGFPSTTLPCWVTSAKLCKLQKLYIRGGKLRDLSQLRDREGRQWKVKIIRLKYLSDLAIDWGELRRLFPQLIYLHQEDCPKLKDFPCDESGVWMDSKATYIQEQLQKYFRNSGISSSSMLGSGSTSASDDDLAENGQIFQFRNGVPEEMVVVSCSDSWSDFVGLRVSKPKPLENIIHSDASTTSKDDDHVEPLSLSSKLIRSDLLLVDLAFAEAKEYMDHLNVKFKQAHEKFEKLQTLGSNQRDFDELRKTVVKLKFQIPSHAKMRSIDSNPRRNQ